MNKDVTWDLPITTKQKYENLRLSKPMTSLIQARERNHELQQAEPLLSHSIISLEKVKAFHTRYRALDPVLIPVYKQSARRWL